VTVKAGLVVLDYAIRAEKARLLVFGADPVPFLVRDPKGAAPHRGTAR